MTAPFRFTIAAGLISASQASVWLPSKGDYRISGCFNSKEKGNISIVQCGGPTVTQIANSQGQNEIQGGITEFVGIQDHTIVFVDHDGVETVWPGSNPKTESVTQWAMHGAFTAAGYSRSMGHSVSSGKPPPRSLMGLGYTAYTITGDFNLSYNQFLVTSPSGVSYYLQGCPTLPLGGKEVAGECPSLKKSAGEFKFSILGLLSGAAINSLNSVTPPASTSKLDTVNKDFDRDLAQYKTMIYRSWIDVSNLGASPQLWVSSSNSTIDGKNFSDLNESDDLGGATLHFVGTQSASEVQLLFESTYSVGNYTRVYQDMVDTFGWPCTDWRNCAKDATGFDAEPKSLREGFNPDVKKIGNSSLTTAKIRAMGGAPDLLVEKVESMKITMRRAKCSGRPKAPLAFDMYGTNNVSWPDAPPDCPWWYKATMPCSQAWEMCNGSTLKWRVDKGMHQPACGDMGRCSDNTNVKTLVFDDLISCLEGSCFFVDFHIDLGGKTESERTLFGNPENAPPATAGRREFSSCMIQLSKLLILLVLLVAAREHQMVLLVAAREHQIDFQGKWVQQHHQCLLWRLCWLSWQPPCFSTR